VQLHARLEAVQIGNEYAAYAASVTCRIMNCFPKKLLAFCHFVFVTVCNTEDILGCGGFVKSDIDINFSQVEVKL
jgi:hypothetical protein